MPRGAGGGRALLLARRRQDAKRKAAEEAAKKKAIEDAERLRSSVPYDPDLDASEAEKRLMKMQLDNVAHKKLLVLEEQDTPIEAEMIPEADDDAPCFEIVLIGAGGAGKTSLIQQYLNSYFPCKYTPTVTDQYRVPMRVNGEDMVIILWDTAGQDLYRLLPEEHYQAGKAFIMVYSVASEPSFRQTEKFRKELEENRQPRDQVPLMLVANKADVPSDERQVLRELGEIKAQRWKSEQFEQPREQQLGKVMFTEVSSKDNRGVQTVFDTLLCVLMNDRDKLRQRQQDEEAKQIEAQRASKCTIS